MLYISTKRVKPRPETAQRSCFKKILTFKISWMLTAKGYELFS